MKNLEKLVTGVLTLVQLGGIVGLTTIGLKRNEDAYKAERKCIDLELDNIMKDCEIYKLKRDIEELKKKYNIKDEDLD